MLTVGETGSTVALDTFATPVTWRLTTPENARDFSATCYFHARELQKTIDVPMGLVVAAWGGSRIQAWTSAAALAARGDLAEELAVLREFGNDPASANARWGKLWGAWWQARSDVRKGDAPWLIDYREVGEWADAPAGLGAWERWNVPALAAYDGMLWYRTTLHLSRAQAQQSAVLELGSIDEIDMTWLNGRAVGSTYGPGQGREYPVPKGVLRAGDNAVVINVLDTYRDGGLAGPQTAHALRFEDGTRIVLDGGWRWRAAPGSDWPPRAPWHTAAGLSTLYNGMISPIGRYGFRAIIWYQGESNSSEAATYGSQLADLIGDWRQRFGPELPWLNVQLAGYGAAATKPGESGWAALREVQRRYVERDARYGVATAVDIGDRYDIHPSNKQELGRRLARLARHLVYGERTLVSTGPQPASARRDGEEVVLSFVDVSDGLVAYGADAPIGFELCTESADDSTTGAGRSSTSGTGSSEAPWTAKRSCRYADAILKGDEVRLRHRDAAFARAATHVRHAWADNPIITLFDGVGLPAQPFELPITAASSER